MTLFEEISSMIITLEKKRDKILILLQGTTLDIKMQITSPTILILDEIAPHLLKVSYDIIREEIEKLKKQLIDTMYPTTIQNER